MRNGILLNNDDMDDFSIFLIKAGLADFPVHSDSLYLHEKYEERKKVLDTVVLSKIYLYDEIYIVQPDMWVEYSKAKSHMDLNTINQKPIRDLDPDYAAYIKAIIMQTVCDILYIEKENRIYPLIEEMYDSVVSIGGLDLDMRCKFLESYGEDVIHLAKSNLNVSWEDDKLLWNVFSSVVFESIWHYTNEFILNIENSSIRGLVISGSHMNYVNYHYEEKEQASYKILKAVINDYYIKTPVFSDIEEMMRFKENNRIGINSLRNEISNIEMTIRNCNSERALEKAVKDVAKAQNSLLRNSQYNRVSKIATYLSIPVGVIDSLFTGSFLGFSLSVVGTIATALSDINTQRNNWINLIR